VAPGTSPAAARGPFRKHGLWEIQILCNGAGKLEKRYHKASDPLYELFFSKTTVFVVAQRKIIKWGSFL